MQRITKISASDHLLGFELKHEDGTEFLTTQDLMDFVDSDVPLYYRGEKMTVNDYLGDSQCFSARVASSSYNPFRSVL